VAAKADPRENGAVNRLPRRLGRALVAASAATLALPAAVLAHGQTAPAPELPGVLLAWRLDPLPFAGVAVAAIAYLWMARGVSTAHPANRPSAWRTVAFMAGLAAILLALVSPIEAYEGQLFSVHMIQHMLLELVAAPLLLLGAPGGGGGGGRAPPPRR
jgi:hypothetical protein